MTDTDIYIKYGEYKSKFEFLRNVIEKSIVQDKYGIRINEDIILYSYMTLEPERYKKIIEKLKEKEEKKKEK